MSLLPTILAGAPSDPVTLPNIDLYNQIASGVCYSGIRFGADGLVYRAQGETGNWSAAGTWLFSGNASDYYLVTTLNDGTLNVTDAGRGPLQMNVNRDFQLSTVNITSASLTASISNDMSGTPVVVTRNYTPSAEVGFN